MRISAELPATLPLMTVGASWSARVASFLLALRRLGRSARSLGPRTTLVKDPFAAEQSRD